MIDPQALLIAGSILIVAIALFALWLSHNKTKRRLRRLENRHSKEDNEE